MTTSRFLPLLNLAGCLLITGIIVIQWVREHRLDERIKTLSHQLVTSRGQTADAEKRSAALEADVTQLKTAIEATAAARKEAEETARAEVDKIATEHNEKMAQLATASEEQVKSWQAAIATRDGKIRELNAALATTRKRLDEAIATLREAGAR